MSNTSSCTEHSVLSSGSAAHASLIFYALLGVIGVLGNAHVVLVFRSRRERSLRFLVLFLSCLDLIISGVILPLDCYRVYAEYTTGGRLRWHFLGTVILSSRQAAFELEGCVLVLIAVDRFLCVVKARRDGLSYRRAVAALLASGAAVGLMETGNVVTHYLIEDDCKVKIRLESYLLVFYGALGTCSIVLVAALYARILAFVAAMERRRSCRRATTRKTLMKMTRRSGGPATSSSAGSCTFESPALVATPMMDDAADDAAAEEASAHQCGGGGANGCRSRSPTVRFSLECAAVDGDADAATPGADEAADALGRGVRPAWFPRRLALMLFGASVLFYLSLLPGILINFSIITDSPLHRLYYLNSSLNFAVYALLNPKFRSDLRQLYSRRCCL